MARDLEQVRLVASLDEIRPAESAAWGGKATHLALLRQRAYPVPEGFVVHSRAFRSHLDRPHVRHAHAAARSRADFPAAVGQYYWDRLCLAIRLEPLSGELREAIAAALGGLWPEGAPLLAVRSSAAAEDSREASFAGAFRTELGVGGQEALWDAVRACWASAFMPRALTYAAALGGSGPGPMAVLIERLVPADAAGVAFTVDSSSPEPRMAIEAVPGLAEALASGRELPRRILLAREDGKLRPVEADGDAAASLLNPAEALELGDLLLRVEAEFGEPQDVEWAREDGRWWIVQARPITRWREARPHDEKTTWPWGENLWSTANVGEVLPGVVTPLTASSLEASLPETMQRNFGALGFRPAPATPLMRRFSGRMYFNLAAFQWLSWQGWGMSPAESNASMGGNQPELPLPDPRSAPLRQRLAWFGRKLLAMRAIVRALRAAPAAYRAAAAEARAVRRTDARALDDLQLLDFLFRQRRVVDTVFPYFMQVSAGASGTYLMWTRLADRWLPPGESAAWLLAGHGGIPSADHGHALRELGVSAAEEPAVAEYLMRLADDGSRPVSDWRDRLAGSRTIARIDDFLDRFGHRAIREWEFAQPRWSEDPTYVLRTLGTFVRDATETAPTASETLAARGSASLDPVRRTILRMLASQYQRAASLRESGKSLLVELTADARAAALEVGRRLASRAHLPSAEAVFYLERAEIAAYLLGELRPDGLAELAARRRDQLEVWERLEIPGVFSGDEPPEAIASTGLEFSESPSGQWAGLGLSPGRAAGQARVLLSPEEGFRLRRGEVLVAPFADPAWTPLFLRAAGLVLEIGGYLSHGAIVAREYGVPAVANLSGITRAVRDGDYVSLDGTTGCLVVERAGHTAPAALASSIPDRGQPT